MTINSHKTHSDARKPARRPRAFIVKTASICKHKSEWHSCDAILLILLVLNADTRVGRQTDNQSLTDKSTGCYLSIYLSTVNSMGRGRRVRDRRGATAPRAGQPGREGGQETVKLLPPPHHHLILPHCLPIVCRVVGHCLRAFHVMLCYVLSSWFS